MRRPSFFLYLCKRNQSKNKIMATTTIPQTQFATLAIGATAQRMGITATELHNRLKQHGLVKRLLFDCYDTLHTESIDGVVWNVTEALRNWEAKEGGQS
jgi:hypothetical protein